MRTYLDLPYTENPLPCQHLDLYLPDTDSFSLFVYFHGGGLEHGDKAFRNHRFCEYLTARGIAVASANYRMYPDAAYPDFICDAAAAVAWCHSHIAQYGNCRKIFVGGSSAGGFLSMMLCFDPRYLRNYGIDCTALGGYVHDAGQPTCHFNVLRERGLDTRRIIVDESAPLYHIGTLPSYAPMLLIVSDHDMENRPQQTDLLLSTLHHFRYDFDKIEVLQMHGTHCSYCGKADESGESLFAKMICPFLKKHS